MQANRIVAHAPIDGAAQTIFSVTHDGTTTVRHMDPNLVEPTGFGLTFEQ